LVGGFAHVNATTRQAVIFCAKLIALHQQDVLVVNDNGASGFSHLLSCYLVRLKFLFAGIAVTLL
jgi:hypothetical protein